MTQCVLSLWISSEAYIIYMAFGDCWLIRPAVNYIISKTSCYILKIIPECQIHKYSDERLFQHKDMPASQKKPWWNIWFSNHIIWWADVKWYFRMTCTLLLTIYNAILECRPESKEPFKTCLLNTKGNTIILWQSYILQGDFQYWSVDIFILKPQGPDSI